MMKVRRKREARFGRRGLPVTVTLIGAVLMTVAAREKIPGYDALDYGFRFASAIKTDVKDMGMAQTAIVMELAELGDLDTAVKRAPSIANWRRGTVLADLAAMLAQQDRPQEARKLLAEAKQFRDSLDGWETRRIDAHIAQAYAMLGDMQKSEQLAEEVAESDLRQYRGRSVATVAAAYAARGEFERAMEYLGQLRSDEDYDVTWWRTSGYVEVASQQGLPKGKRFHALREAVRSSDGIDGWKQAEALISIADSFLGLGARDEATTAVRKADKVASAVSKDAPSRAYMLATLAQAWGRVGAADRARELLAEAGPLIPEMLVIDQPGYYAQLARGYVELGDREAADEMYGVALDSAASLENARPRALAIVAVCRLMARDGTPLKPQVKQRLDDLYSGLRAPW